MEEPESTFQCNLNSSNKRHWPEGIGEIGDPDLYFGGPIPTVLISGPVMDFL